MKKLLKRVMCMAIGASMTASCFAGSAIAAPAQSTQVSTAAETFNSETVLWTNEMIDEGFADKSPNASNSTSSGVQSPYGRSGDTLTDWAYYEYLWTHGYPIGNGRMAATVMGGIDKEVIQVNEDTSWTGSPYTDPTTGEQTSGSTKDGWKYFRGSNEDGTPAAIGSSDALVGDDAFRTAYPDFAKKTISYQALNVDNSETQTAVQGRYDLESMIEKYFLGNPTRQKSYQSFVEMYMDFGQKNADVTNYTKSLDLETAVAKVEYDAGGAHFTRETIASYPDQVIATNVKVSGGTLNFDAQLHTYLENPQFEKVADNQVKITAKVKDGKTAEPGGASAIKIEARLLVDAKDSTLTVLSDNSGINISGGTEASIYIVGATNYVSYLTVDDSKPKQDCDKYIAGLSGKTYADIKARHIADYSELFSRTSLTLGNTGSNDYSATTTENRVRKDVGSKDGFEVGAGNSLGNANDAKVYSTLNDGDNKLVTLMFNYGKYLLIAGSRDEDKSAGIEMSQPLNLTGKWNPSLSPSWNGKYTININTEMNYWAAQPLDLAETERPLIAVLSELAQSGSITAKEQYAITNSRGDEDYKPGDPWVMHHNFDLWRGTQPIDNATAGVWPTGGVWLLDHAWQYYKFNLDKDYLAEFYPIMKGACEFFTQFLVVDPKTGYLITAASVSPEQGSVQPGPAMDTQLIRNLYDSTLQAAEVLGKTNEDAALLAKVKEQMPESYLANEKGKVAPNLIDNKRLIKEWVRGDVTFDFSGGTTWNVTNPFTGKTEGFKKHDASNSSGHRHCSHLWEMFPGTHLSAYSDDANEQDIYDAYKRSVGARGAGSGQGWGLAWRINLSARALDGASALERIEQLVRTRTSPNLFDQHPNFQIDGNYGLTSGVIEMLMQSHDGVITILPALPDSWQSGEFKGFKARGGTKVSAAWEEGKPTSIEVVPASDGDVSIRSIYVGKAVVKTKSGETVASTLNDDLNMITFSGKAGETYVLEDLGRYPSKYLEETWTKPISTAKECFASDGGNAPKLENNNTDVGYMYNREGVEVGFKFPSCDISNLSKVKLYIQRHYAGNNWVSLRLDKCDGTEIAKSNVTGTGDLEMDVTLPSGVTGTHDIYAVFYEEPYTGTNKWICNVGDLTGIQLVPNPDYVDPNPPANGYDYTFETASVNADGTVTVNLAYSGAEENPNDMLIIAQYNSSGEMIKTDTVAVSGGGAVDTSKVSVESGAKVKMFVWNDINELTPLSAVVEK